MTAFGVRDLALAVAITAAWGLNFFVLRMAPSAALLGKSFDSLRIAAAGLVICGLTLTVWPRNGRRVKPCRI